MRAPVGGLTVMAPVGADLRRRRFEVVAADPEHRRPGGAGIVIDPLGRARTPDQGSGRGRSDGRRISQDLLHSRIGIEGLALHDADGSQRPHDLRIERADRLLLHQIVDQLEIAEVVWRHRVHDLAGAFDELRRLLGRRKAQSSLWSGVRANVALPSNAEPMLVPYPPGR